MTRPGLCKAPYKAPLSPAAAARRARMMVKSGEADARERARRKAHPRLVLALDLAVGLPIIAAVFALFLAYFRV